MDRAAHFHTESVPLLPLLPVGSDLLAVPDEMRPDVQIFDRSQKLRFILSLHLYSKVSASEKGQVYWLCRNQLFECMWRYPHSSWSMRLTDVNYTVHVSILSWDMPHILHVSLTCTDEAIQVKFHRKCCAVWNPMWDYTTWYTFSITHLVTVKECKLCTD